MTLMDTSHSEIIEAAEISFSSVSVISNALRLKPIQLQDQ